MTSSARQKKQGAVLVFGESVNDSQSILHLLIAANASLAGRVRSLRRPVSLTRQAKPNAVRDWGDELRRTVQAFEANEGRVAAVIVHRDADGYDPGGAVAADLARQLTTIGAHPVVPVQAIEAWWSYSLTRSRRSDLTPGRASCRVNVETSSSSISRRRSSSRRPRVGTRRSTRHPTPRRLLLTSGRGRSSHSVRASRTTAW